MDDDLDDIITYMGWEDIKYIFVNGFIMHINYIKIYKLSILDFIVIYYKMSCGLINRDSFIIDFKK